MNINHQSPTIKQSSNTPDSTNTPHTTTNQTKEPGLKIDEINSAQKIPAEDILNGEKQHIKDTESLKPAAPIYNESLIKYNDSLIIALKEENEARALEIIKDNNVDINFQDENKNTALMWAICTKQKKSALEILKRNDVNINHQDKKGNTALIFAIIKEQKDIALIILDIIKKDNAFVTSENPIKPINLQDKNGNTALLGAILNKQTDIALKILDLVDVNVNLKESRNGHTALIMAIIEGEKIIAFKILDMLMRDSESGMHTGAVNPINLQDNAGNTALMEAIDKDQVNVALEILKNNSVDINLKDIQGNTALLLAIKNKLEKIATKILDRHDIELNVTNFEDLTPLMIAILNEENEIVVKILKHPNMNINFQNKHGATALMCAIEKKQKDIALQILQRNDANINLQDINSDTTLMWAIEKDQDIALNVLKDPNVDINLQNKDKYTALSYAIINGYEEIALQILQNKDIKVNLYDKNGSTALMWAIEKDQKDIALKILKDPNMNINHQMQTGKTALMMAILKGQTDIALEILKHKDIDVNVQDKDGNTALIWAIDKGQGDIALEILQRNDVNINLQDKDGNTALIYAIAKKQEDIALEILKKENLDINMRNYNDISALMLAIEKIQMKIAQAILEKNNINVNLQDKNGSTALIRAIGTEHIESENIALEILKKENLDINIKNNQNISALMWAIEKDQKTIAKKILDRKDVDVNFQNDNGINILTGTIQLGKIDIALKVLEREDIEINQVNKTTHLSELERLYKIYKANRLIDTHYLINIIIQHDNFFKNLNQNNLNIAAEFIIQNSNNSQILNLGNSTDTMIQIFDHLSNLSEISKNENLNEKFIRCLDNEKIFWSLFKHLAENISEQRINMDWALAILMPYITNATDSKNPETSLQKIIAFEVMLFEKISNFETNQIIKEVISKINIKKTDCIKDIIQNYRTTIENSKADEALENLTLKTNFTDAGILHLTEQQQKDNAKKIENYKNHKEDMNDYLNSLDNLYNSNEELTIIEIKQLNTTTKKYLKILDRLLTNASNEINELTKLDEKRIPYETFLTNEYNELEKNIQELTFKVSQPSDLSINLYETLTDKYDVQNLLYNNGVKKDVKIKAEEFNKIKNNIDKGYLSVERFYKNQDDISMLFYELNDHMSNIPSTDNIKDQETHFSEWITIKKRLTTTKQNLNEINAFHEDAIKYINDAVIKKVLSILKNQPKLGSIAEGNETTTLSLKKPPIEALFESMDELGISISTSDTKSIVSSVSSAISIATSLDQKEGEARKQEINAIKTSIISSFNEISVEVSIQTLRKKILGPIIPYLRKLSGYNVDQTNITKMTEDYKHIRKNDKLQYELTIRNNTPHGKGIEKSKKYHSDDIKKIQTTHINGIKRLNDGFKLFEIGEITLNHEKIKFLTDIYIANMSNKQSGSSHYSFTGPLLIPDNVQILSSDLIYDRWIALKVFDEAFDNIKKTEAAKLKKAATQKAAPMP